jgi:GT2 family glycosyltransferase
MEVARQFGEFLVFIDDDEVPMNQWLKHLVSCQEDYDADAVSGPVVPHFTSDVPEWIRVGRFFDRERYPTGTHLKESRTGNTLLKLSAFDRIGGFDEKFTLTGGEDGDWFARLHQSGGRIVWCNEAVVEDWVPAQRARVKWLLARAYRTGNTAFLLTKHEGRSRTIVRGVLRVCKGVCVVTASAVKGKAQAVRGMQKILNGAGVIVGAIGRR